MKDTKPWAPLVTEDMKRVFPSGSTSLASTLVDAVTSSLVVIVSVTGLGASLILATLNVIVAEDVVDAESLTMYVICTVPKKSAAGSK